MRRLVINIFDKCFVLDHSGFGLFSEDGDLYGRYHNKNIFITSDCEIGNKNTRSKIHTDGNKCPIYFKYKIASELIVSISEQANIELIIDDTHIKPGSEYNIDMSRSDSIEYTIIYDKKRFSNQIKNDEIKTSDIEDKNIIDLFNEPYNHNSKSNKYYSLESDSDKEVHNNDLSIMNRIDNVEGINLISSGSSRKVFRIKNSDCLNISKSYKGCVLKVARDSLGINVNKHEFQAWQNLKSTKLEKYFCPILDRGQSHKYLIMEFAKCIDNSDFSIDSEFEDFKHKLNNTIEESSLKYGSLDISKSNIGMYNGNLVMIDYPYGGKINTL